MRRLLGMLALIGFGVLVGFVVRLVWPRSNRSSVVVYPGPLDPTAPSVRR